MVRCFTCKVICWWLLLLLAPVIQAGEGLDRLDTFHREVRTFKADFQQILLDSEQEVVQESSGTVVIKRPQKFRWDYKKPYPQEIVADGEKIWIYDSDLEQVTVKKESNTLGQSPAQVLSGSRPLKEDFQIKELGPKDKLEWIELVPKTQDTDFVKIRIAFTKDLERMELVDQFNQTTRIKFSNVQTNTSLPTDLFKFNVPKGVEVVGE